MNPFKKIMEKDNLTLEELGKILGVSKQAVHQLSQDKTKPNSKVLLKLILLYKDYYTPLDLYMYYYGKE